MALNPLQLNNINQNLATDRAIKSQFLSNPALTGNTGISPFLNGSTLGGVGLDTLASMGVVGLGSSSDAQIQQELAKTNDLFSIGLSMSAPGSLAQSLAQKAMTASQQQSQNTLRQLMQQQQTISQQLQLKQRLGLPVTQQEQFALLQLQQQMQSVLLQQQSFQSTFLGTGTNSLSGLGASSAASSLGGLGSLGFGAGLGLQGSGSNPFTTGILGANGLNSAAAPTSPLAQVWGGLGAGTGYGGVPFYQGGYSVPQQPQYMMMPYGYAQMQPQMQQQPYAIQPGVYLLPPIVLSPQ